MDMNRKSELLLLVENPYLRHRGLKPKRQFWVKPIFEKRTRLGEFHHLHDELWKDAAKFFNYHRMSLETFTYILHVIRPSIEKSSNFRDTISPDERLTTTLRYSATGSSFKTLGFSFRISDVTVGRIVQETCRAIWDKLQPIHMAVPNNDEMGPIIKGFWDKWCFPNCVGCIDGKHIRIQNPKHSGSMFRQYKQFVSVVLQAVAGPDYKFIAIDVGAYGKESDGGIFNKSNLSRRLERGALGAKRKCPT
uniref:DDE Tnp4 domain-containing protein n=1 Tax=Leptobrachium leishanense TaxID=445787 RepID=A0A8C5WCY3_9ANUR